MFTMATKTITITVDAYDRLFVLKRETESFSDVIRRVAGRVKLSDFAGILTKEEGNALKERIRKNRLLSTKRMDKIRGLLQ
jgi:predicted CopG family antitoxin